MTPVDRLRTTNTPFVPVEALAQNLVQYGFLFSLRAKSLRKVANFAIRR